MVQRAMVLLCVCSLAVFMLGCGQTYELQSITVSPTTANLEGYNATQVLTVTAHYSNTKTQDVTANSTYQVSQATAGSDPNTPNGAVTVNNSGIVETSNSIWACTWRATQVGTSYTYGVTSPYIVTVKYSGFTTSTAVAVASGPSCYDGITYNHP
jgi:hypothetical protein